MGYVNPLEGSLFKHAPFPKGKKNSVDLSGRFSDHQAPLGDAPALCRAQTAMALGGPKLRLRKSVLGTSGSDMGKIYPPGN